MASGFNVLYGCLTVFISGSTAVLFNEFSGLCLWIQEFHSRLGVLDPRILNYVCHLLPFLFLFFIFN